MFARKIESLLNSFSYLQQLDEAEPRKYNNDACDCTYKLHRAPQRCPLAAHMHCDRQHGCSLLMNGDFSMRAPYASLYTHHSRELLQHHNDSFGPATKASVGRFQLAIPFAQICCFWR
jgi:hypothetical protein